MSPAQSVSSKKTAVLLLAHGSPDSVADVPQFLLQVTRGRALPPEVIAEVSHRYALIGRSPLTELTRRQGESLARKLGLPVYIGMRNWKPFIPAALHEMANDGIEHALVICMAPQNSSTSVGLYRSTLGDINQLPFDIDFTDSWHDHPLLIQAFAEKLSAGLAKAREELGNNPPVIFTAHSVPQRTVTDGDPYQSQANETAMLVAAAACPGNEDWRFAFQSQGMSGGPWIGPTVEETILALKKRGHQGILVQPIGFLCDHVEVLYDIDIAFRKFADGEGMRLWRTESLNDSPLLIAAMADIVRSRTSGANSSPMPIRASN